MGTPAPSGPEVLGNGREPEPDRPSDDTPPAARKLRAPRGLWAIGLAVALLLGGVWYAGRPDLDGSPSLPKTSGTGNHQQSAAPDATTLVSGLAEGHDLAAPSSPALDSFIASGGHVLLFMQVKNIGAEPLRILDGVVPQDGTSRDLNAGGLSAGTSGGGVLQPGDQTEIFLRLTVRCPEVLDGPAAKAVLLVAEQPGRHPRLERVRTDALGSYWDEARQAACRPSETGDVSARVVPQSVRAVRADDGSLTVSAVLVYPQLRRVRRDRHRLGRRGRWWWAAGCRRRVDPVGADALGGGPVRTGRRAGEPGQRSDVPGRAAPGRGERSGAARRQLRRRVDLTDQCGLRPHLRRGG